MNITKIILATTSYVVITKALAYLWHIIWLHDAYVAMGAYTRIEQTVP